MVFFGFPGVLVAGPIGIEIGGRRWFWPAGLIGSLIRLVILLLEESGKNSLP
jgi:hypothetical protein